jgi:hypothetical protein
MDEQSNEMETPNPEAEQPFTITDEVSGQEIVFGPGLAGSVSAQENVSISKGAALVISAGKDASLVDGGAMAIPVGRDLTLVNGGAMVMPVGGNAEIVNGGGWIMPVGGNVDLANGGAGMMFTSEASVKNSYVGLLFSGNTTIDESSRVLLDTKQAIAFGAAFGAAFALLSLLFRRKS